MLAPGQCSGVAALWRGGILAILPGNRITVLDYVVTHPCAASYAQSASQGAGSAAVMDETWKRLRDLVMALAMNSCPWLWSPLAGWRNEVVRFLTDLSVVDAANGRASKAAIVRIVLQELSCTLCWGNARMHDRSLIFVAHGAGSAFMPSSGRVVDEAGEV